MSGTAGGAVPAACGDTVTVAVAVPLEVRAIGVVTLHFELGAVVAQLRFTLPAKPFVEESVRVYVAVLPRGTVCVAPAPLGAGNAKSSAVPKTATVCMLLGASS